MHLSISIIYVYVYLYRYIPSNKMTSNATQLFPEPFWRMVQINTLRTGNIII